MPVPMFFAAPELLLSLALSFAPTPPTVRPTAAPIVAVAPAPPTAAWTFTAPKDLIFFQLSPLGTLLVSTEAGLQSLDPATGAVQWTRDDIQKLPATMLDLIPDTPYALITRNTGLMNSKSDLIDLATGQTKWTSETLGLALISGQVIVPEAKMLLVTGSDKKGKVVLVGADLETGAVRWTQEKVFDKPLRLFVRPQTGRFSLPRTTLQGNQPALVGADGTAIVYLSEDGPIKLNLATGATVWTGSVLKGKPVPASADGYGRMRLIDGTLYVPTQKSLQAFDAATGAPRFAKMPGLKSGIVQMAMTPAGLVVRGGPTVDSKGKPSGSAFIDVLDPATGVSKWRKPFKDLNDATSFAIQGDQIFFATDDEVFAIDLASGTSTSQGKFKFKGNEQPSSLTLMDGDFLLTSSQNVMRMAPGGAVKFHTYKPAPGASGFAKITSTIAVLTVNAMVASAAYDRAQSTGRDQEYTMAGNPTLSRRFKASQQTRTFQTILTDVKEGSEKGAGLVKVNLATGAVDNQIVLKDKEPTYELDEIDGRLFYQASDKQIVCYSY